MNCNHTSYDTCLHDDECAECLREQAARWRKCAERLRAFALLSSSRVSPPKLNLEEQLVELLALYDSLTTTIL